MLPCIDKSRCWGCIFLVHLTYLKTVVLLIYINMTVYVVGLRIDVTERRL